MAKGLAKSAADAVRGSRWDCRQRGGHGCGYTRSRADRGVHRRGSRKQPPSHGPGPVVDQAVQRLLAPPVKHKARKVVKKAAAKKQKSVPRAKKALQKKRDAGRNG